MGDHNNWGTSELSLNNQYQNHNQVGLDVPKFKSVQPPSLPLSPSPVSPSSYLNFSSAFSPSELLNSPLFFPSPNVSYKLSCILTSVHVWGITNCRVLISLFLCVWFQIFASPTTEALVGQSFNWRNGSGEEQQRGKEDEKNYSDFSFQTQIQSSLNMFQVVSEHCFFFFCHHLS